ncbi:MAG: hypothetical protein II696_05935 [Firmicutes bacterium]|nr:hypothetical protein [Bacillota bacterium]
MSGQRRRHSQKKKNHKAVVYIIGLLVILIAVIGFKNISGAPDGSDIRLTDEGYTHANRFKSSVAVTGIDVSSHQGDDINWEMVKSSGVDFVFVRAGVRLPEDGSIHKDKCFDRNVKNARKAGLLIGAYFYSQATTTEEAAEEADFILDTVSGKDIDLPLVIDYELYQGGRLSAKAQSGELFAASQYNDIVTAFTSRIEQSGYDSGVYANYDMLTNYMDASLIAGQTEIWVAQYNNYCSFVPSYMFWQCSDSAQVGGIDGNVDHDFWYIQPNKVYSASSSDQASSSDSSDTSDSADTSNQAPSSDSSDTSNQASSSDQASDSSASNAISIGECTVEFDKDAYRIKKRRATPDIEVSYNGSTLKEGSDYTCTPIRNIDAGTGYMFIRGIGDYKDWKAVPFTIK